MRDYSETTLQLINRLIDDHKRYSGSDSKEHAELLLKIQAECCVRIQEIFGYSKHHQAREREALDIRATETLKHIKQYPLAHDEVFGHVNETQYIHRTNNDTK